MRRFVVIVLIGIALSFLFSIYAFAAPTTCQIANGCTGTSNAPAYGKILIGGQNGEYEYVASSTFGGGGGGGSGGTGAATSSFAATYPLLLNTSASAITYSMVATSSLNLTVSSFLSQNISQ